MSEDQLKSIAESLNIKVAKKQDLSDLRFAILDEQARVESLKPTPDNKPKKRGRPKKAQESASKPAADTEKPEEKKAAEQPKKARKPKAEKPAAAAPAAEEKPKAQDQPKAPVTAPETPAEATPAPEAAGATKKRGRKPKTRTDDKPAESPAAETVETVDAPAAETPAPVPQLTGKSLSIICSMNSATTRPRKKTKPPNSSVRPSVSRSIRKSRNRIITTRGRILPSSIPPRKSRSRSSSKVPSRQPVSSRSCRTATASSVPRITTT